MPFKDKEKAKVHQKEWRRKDYQENPEKYVAYHKKQRKEYRNRVFIHYSGDPPKCACCGETTNEFLTVDHIGGRRKGDVKTGYVLYSWLIKNNFPVGFQILCFNCNCAKGFFGVCPHNKKGGIRWS